jgi:MazG family protein
MTRAAQAIERLLAIMARLRGPGGCPWDREQTLRTLRPYLLEETHEVLEAIESGDAAEHREELGDLLLQIVFQAQLAQEEGRFDFADVAEAISRKLVSRHPHVFGDAEVGDAEGVMRQWVALKRKEKQAKGGGQSVLEGVPREMPGLARAERLTEKASRIGFDWAEPAGARAKVAEELAELDAAVTRGDRASTEDEIGDLLLAVANLARKLSVPPEEALRRALGRFIQRFQYVERELERRGVSQGSATLEQMDELWEEAKDVLDRDERGP